MKNLFKLKKICFNQKYTYKTKTPSFNMDYICNANNKEKFLKNINIRKGVGDILLINELNDKLLSAPEKEKNHIRESILQEIYKLPNDTHPDVINYGDQPREVEFINSKREFDFKPLDFGDIGKKMNILRTDNLSPLTGKYICKYLLTLA